MEPYIENPFQTNIPVLAAMHREADGIQSYMDIPIDLQDPASLTERLKYIDVYMARLTDLMIRAKAIKEREKNKFISDNEDKINKLTATVSNRMIDAHLYEYAVAYTRLDASSTKELFADCAIVVEAFDVVEAKAMLLAALAGSEKKLVTASGLAGWGRSNAIRLRRMGSSIIAVGDGETSVGAGVAPVSPRVGIAAAMQANAVVSLLLGEEP